MTDERSRGPVLTVLAILMSLLAVSNFSNRRRWVVPLAIAYAAYVVPNLVLFATTAPPAQVPGIAFMATYAAVAIGVSAGGALSLYRNRQRLR